MIMATIVQGFIVEGEPTGKTGMHSELIDYFVGLGVDVNKAMLLEDVKIISATSPETSSKTYEYAAIYENQVYFNNGYKEFYQRPSWGNDEDEF